VIKLNIEIEQETDKRWLAWGSSTTFCRGSVGRTEIEAFSKALTIAYRMLAEREPCLSV